MTFDEDHTLQRPERGDVVDARREVLDLVLDHPLSLHAGRHGSHEGPDGGGGTGAGMSAAPLPAAMGLVDPVEMLRERVEAAGSQAAWARIHGMPASAVSEVLSGCRAPGRRVLHALGLKRVTTVVYRRQF